jgi:ferredoxin
MATASISAAEKIRAKRGLFIVAGQRLPNSRLSCQIKIRSELDGLILHPPERQI